MCPTETWTKQYSHHPMGETVIFKKWILKHNKLWTDKLIGKSLANRHQCPSSTIPIQCNKVWGTKHILWSGCNHKILPWKTRNPSRVESFSIMFYVVSLEQEISRKGRYQEISKISYFLTAWTLLLLDFGPNAILLFTSFSTKNESLWKSWFPFFGESERIIQARRYWPLLYAKSRLWCLKCWKFLEMKSRKKKSWCDYFHLSSLSTHLKW